MAYGAQNSEKICTLKDRLLVRFSVYDYVLKYNLQHCKIFFSIKVKSAMQYHQYKHKMRLIFELVSCRKSLSLET